MNLPTIIICVILVIIICIGIRSTKKRATSGCCGSSETVKKIRIKDKNKEHYPYKVVLKVYDIHCQNCVRTIENAFNSQEGFYAKVNTEDNTVTILSNKNWIKKSSFFLQIITCTRCCNRKRTSVM